MDSAQRADNNRRAKMIDVYKIEEIITKIVEECGASVLKVGASEKSDSIYINIRKPKEMWEGRVLESWEALIRVSNHFNDYKTHDRLTADFFANIYDEREIDAHIEDLKDFLSQCECIN